MRDEHRRHADTVRRAARPRSARACRPGRTAAAAPACRRVATAPSTAITQPAVWNSGIGAELDVARPQAQPRAVDSRALLTIPRWCSTRALGEAGRAGGVLDLRGVVAGAPRAAAVGVAARAERRPVGERHDLAQRRAGRRAPAATISAIGLAAVAATRNRPSAVRLAAARTPAPRPQRRVDGDQRDARPGRRRAPRITHSGMLLAHTATCRPAGTGPAARGRRARTPPAARRRSTAAGPPGPPSRHQRGGVRRRRRRAAQDVADGKVHDRLREVGGPVRGRERHDPPRLHVIPDADARRTAAAGLSSGDPPLGPGRAQDLAA